MATTADQRRSPPMSCHSGAGWPSPSGASSVAKTALSDVEVLGVALLEVGDAERGDQALHDRRTEHVGDEHGRNRLGEAVRAVERDCPLAPVNSSGWMPSSMPTSSAAAVIPT